MSSCEIYAVKTNGEVSYYDRAKNAWGGAMHIWQTLAKKHIGDGFSFFADMKPVWNLADNESVPMHERIVLASTFDKAIAKKDFLPTLIEAFEEFAAEFPTPTLEKEIEILKTMQDDPEVIGVCWNQTSVNGDPWSVYDEDNDDSIPYNINTNDDHWFLEFAPEGGVSGG